MDRPFSPLHPTHAIIDLSAFRHNLNVVRSYVGEQVKIMAVVKANGYGHGMSAMASEALRNGADYLAVARVDEGLELRKEGIQHPLLVFEITPHTHLEEAVSNNLELTVCSVDGAESVSATSARLRRKARVHAKVDTGMGRLGFDYRQAGGILERIARMSGLELVGLYSHFATSDDIDQTFAREQLSRLQVVLEELDRRKIHIPLRHMANSGAIISLPPSYFDMVRPGIMLYGYAPRNGMLTTPPLRPVMSVVSAVTLVKQVSRGTSISYGRKFYASTDTRIATIPIGYADGYPRILSNNTDVLIHGKRCRSVGTICMDHIMVDIGDTNGVDVGDTATLIGKDGQEVITAWDIAEKLRTIPYEVTCMVSSRVPRQYISSLSPVNEVKEPR